ncbi:keratin-associated protein 13-1-like [Trichechus manatus latirostris]|uniref:Keratin-associated protein n=1 Tax=Trichechus manatus latirostris TaxID=127582 RepID=A0A2Y9ED13_TRIMA|nr:keratin-associated protein 13-1-like [Trichechus manatus latirostris]
MSYNCCSGNFSRSLWGSLGYPGSSCGSSSPSHLVYSTGLCFPSTIQLGSSLYRGCQETCCEPSSYQNSCMVSSPCQMSRYHPRTSGFCSPCQKTYTGPLSYGVCGFPSLGYGSRSCYSQGCGSSGFRSLGYGVHGFSSLGHRSRFYCPTYLASRTCQSSCYRPACGSGFY